MDIQSCTLNMLSLAHMLMFVKKSLGNIFSFVYMIFSVTMFSLFKQLFLVSPECDHFPFLDLIIETEHDLCLKNMVA